MLLLLLLLLLIIKGLATVADKPKADNIPSNIPTVVSKTSLTGIINNVVINNY